MSDAVTVMSWLLLQHRHNLTCTSQAPFVTSDAQLRSYLAHVANKHVCGLQARQEMQLGKQQEELFAMKGARSRLVSQINILLGDNEHLEAHVAALEGQRDNMLHELWSAAMLQVILRVT